MAWDYNTMFFNGEAKGNDKSEEMDFHGPDLDDVNYRIVARDGVSGSLTPVLETSDDNVTWATEKQFKPITEEGESHNAYRCKKRYRRMKLNGSGTIGMLEIGIDSGKRYTWQEPAQTA